MSAERRQFHRILMDRPVSCEQQGQTHTAKLVDISLKGALLAITDDWHPEMNSQIEFRVDVTGDGHYEIVANAVVRHREGDQLGIETTHMDIDSASCLRRLVELNLGDPTLLDREFTQLIG